MDYQTFKGLYAEAFNYTNVDEYVLHHDWSEWMNDYQENEIGTLLQTIYQMAHDPLKDIREHQGLSRAAFARQFDIPIRTVENWEYGKTEMPVWQKPLICYALFNGSYYES